MRLNVYITCGEVGFGMTYISQNVADKSSVRFRNIVADPSCDQ